MVQRTNYKTSFAVHHDALFGIVVFLICTTCLGDFVRGVNSSVFENAVFDITGLSGLLLASTLIAVSDCLFCFTGFIFTACQFARSMVNRFYRATRIQPNPIFMESRRWLKDWLGSIGVNRSASAGSRRLPIQERMWLRREVNANPFSMKHLTQMGRECYHSSDSQLRKVLDSRTLASALGGDLSKIIFGGEFFAV